MVSYLAAKILGSYPLYYLFLCTYPAVFVNPFRKYIASSVHINFNIGNICKERLLPVILFFILCINILFFLSRPTPGIVPLDIFHDHVWNAGNTVSLVSDFPLRSMNVETQPYISYHILVHILGAHMSIITDLTPHLVGLQFVFIPIIIMLAFNVSFLLNRFLERRGGYLFYGLAVVLFGGGFTIVHEVKVNSLLNSDTNLIGVALLFAIVACIINSDRFKKTGAFGLSLIGLFLVTAAKGSIGASLFVGMFFWAIFNIWKNRRLTAEIIEAVGTILGFASAYVFFFILPTYGQTVVDALSADSGGSPFLPLSYVTKNAMARPFLDVIYKYAPEHLQLISHILLTVSLLPLYVLLYFSYRLLVFLRIKSVSADEQQQKILFIIFGSLFITYMVNKGPQDHAYFAAAGLFMLDMLFVTFLYKEKVFSLIAEFFKKRQLYGLVGAILIVIMPFISLKGWVKKEYAYNIFMYGRIGQHMDARFSKTEYRRNHQSITPEYYDALQHIRKDCDKNIIVVTPFVCLENGKPLAFYTSAFSERPVYLEGYSFGGITRYVGSSEIERRLKILKDIYENYHVPDELMNNRYVYLADRKTKEGLERKYNIKPLYDNGVWCVLRIRNAL
jgi:hypothetical protein